MSDNLSPKQQNRLENGNSRYFASLAGGPLDISSPLQSASADPVAADVDVQPVLNVGAQKNYNPNGTAQVVSPNLTIVDSDGGNLDGANVIISTNFDPTKDLLGINGATGNTGNIGSINWTYDTTRGVLSFTGTATNEQYQDALKSVTYTNTDTTTPGDARGIQYSLGLPIYFAPNGHYYEFVTDQGVAWTDADAVADGKDYFGLQGYLATITGQAEQTFIQDRLAGNGWIGASDVETADTWKWVNGPETGQTFWSGGPKGNGGSAFNGAYENWRNVNDGGGENEPNNNGGTESYAHVIGNDGIDSGASRGKWNDLPDDRDYSGAEAFEPQGYIVEYGGFEGEVAPQTRGTVNLTFNANANNGLINPDFNEDGTPDILWRNYRSGDGRNAVWTIEYDAASSTAPFSLGSDSKFITEVKEAGWDIEGTADYDQNGVTDLLWRNYADGRNAIWLMENGSTGLELKNGYFITPVTEPGWEIEGAQDFDGDGTQDILWRNYTDGRNAVWSLDYNASNTTNPFALNGTRTGFIDAVDTKWEIAGWDDMTGDGIADVIWRNPTTGQNAVWGLLASGGVPSVDSSKQYFVTPATTDWELEEVVDYNDDGIGDFVWRNYTTGENAIWYMSSGGDIAANGAYYIADATPASEWELEGVADYTGDGIGDILWRNYTTNDTAIWRMRRNGSNGQIELDGGFVLAEKTDDPKWEIESPNPQNDLI